MAPRLGSDPRMGDGASPDRADALVWALTALTIEQLNAELRIRQL